MYHISILDRFLAPGCGSFSIISRVIETDALESMAQQYKKCAWNMRAWPNQADVILPRIKTLSNENWTKNAFEHFQFIAQFVSANDDNEGNI